MKYVGSESELRIQLGDWLQYSYPKLLYRFDLAADLKLTIGQAAKHKRLHPRRGYPDLFIAYPAGKYHGAFFELKAEGKSPYRKDGTLRDNKHLKEQDAYMSDLRSIKYYTTFAVGFDDCVRKIKNYLNGKV